ncbi:hypothetical protein FI667_g17575, partial [Globisporangium splendens]
MLLTALSRCPDVDVFVPATIRGDHEPGRRRRHQVLGKKNKDPVAPSHDPVDKSNPSSAPVPQSSTMGVAVHAMPHINAQQLFGLGFKCAMGLKGGKSLTAHFTTENVCDAIETLLRSTQEQTRHAIVGRIHTQYFLDMHVFVSATTELRTYARSHAQKIGTATTVDGARSPEELRNMTPPPPSPSSADATAKPSSSSPSASSSSVWTLRKSLVVVLGALVALVVWSIGAEYSVLATAKSSFLSLIRTAADVDDDAASVEFYPKEVFEIDWAAKIPDAEQLHLLALHSACVKHKDSVIPWHFGLSVNDENDETATRNPEKVLINENDPGLLEKLRQCPDVDVFLPAGIRSFGYCEDAAAYTKFADAAGVGDYGRVPRRRSEPHVHVPRFVPEHADDLLQPLLGRRSDVSDVAADEAALPHAEHRDVRAPGRTLLEGRRRAVQDGDLRAVPEQVVPPGGQPEEYADHVHAAHDVQRGARGTSIQKGTSRILDCWLTRPHFPPVDIYIAEQLYKNNFESRFDEAIQKADNVNLHVGKLDAVQFGKVIAEGSFFLCPSFQEGYGHYINQARASGGVIVTTDVAPMNELITRDSGVLVHSEVYGFKDQFLGGKSEHPHALRGVQGFVADLRGKDVCASIDAMLSENTPKDYENMAQRAHQQFLFDTIFFAQKMQELREFARAKSHHYLRKEPASVVP